MYEDLTPDERREKTIIMFFRAIDALEISDKINKSEKHKEEIEQLKRELKEFRGY